MLALLAEFQVHRAEKIGAGDSRIDRPKNFD
jgi:hypothetical protein